MMAKASLQDLWIQTFPGLDLADRDAETLRRSFRPAETISETISEANTRAPQPDQQHTLPLAPTRPSEPEADPTGFALGSILGEGGMGVVYRARQRALRRTIALKTFKGQGAQTRERFLSEALVTAALDHPNIVPIHDLQDRDGELFLAMKLIDGRSWRQALDDDKPWERNETLDAHLDILLAVTNAIAFAHHKGFLHLDLKPENVMVGAYGEVLVLDWGLAHATKPKNARLAPLASAIENPCGTPCYMPPELILGQGPKVGPATDIYLLGGLLTDMLDGRPPHRGERLMDLLEDAVNGPPPSLRERWPRELVAIVDRCLAKDPDARYQSVDQLQKALRDFRAQRESILIATRAAEKLDDSPFRARRLRPAQARALYADLARSIAGFEQALELWPGNQTAAEDHRRARMQYAAAALAANDLGLAQDLLAALKEPAPFLQTRLEEAQLSRRRAEDIRRWSRRGILAALAIIILGGGLSLFFIDRARRRALEQRALARREKQRALDALDTSRRSMARAFHERGLRALNQRAALSAELLLSQSLVLADRTETRVALLQARRIPMRQLWNVPQLPINSRARALWINAAGTRFAARLESPGYRALHVGLVRLDKRSRMLPGSDRLALFEATPEHGERAFQGLVFHPYARDRILTASPRGIEAWSIEDGHRVAASAIPGPPARAMALVGDQLAMTRAAELILLKLSNRQVIREPWPCSGPSAAAGERLFTANDASIAVIRSGSPTQILTAAGPVRDLASDARGRTIAARSAENIEVWNLISKPERTMILARPPDGPMSLSHDGALLAVASAEAIAIYQSPRGEAPLRVIRTHGRPTHALAFSTAEPILIAALGSELAAWEVGAEPELGPDATEAGPGAELPLNNEVRASTDGARVVFRLREGAFLGALPPRSGPILGLALSSEKGLLQVRAADGLRGWSIPLIIETLTASPRRLVDAAAARCGLEIDGFTERPRRLKSARGG